VSVERVGEALELGERLTVVGKRLRQRDPAPDFELDGIDPSDSVVHAVRLADSAGQVRLLNVVNSVDTPVCHLETQRWEQLRADLPEDLVVYTVSMDLPYAQARWQTADAVSHQMLSAHKRKRFGRDYGVLIKEWRLLQRAVFVIGRDDRIAYAEYVADQMQEPNYAAAATAAQQALGA
jgi:thiol peroxidase